MEEKQLLVHHLHLEEKRRENDITNMVSGVYMKAKPADIYLDH